jgi:hypothetical protein
MIVYITALFLVITILGLTGRYKNFRSAGLAISFIILWLIAGFRSEIVGNDTKAYIYLFDQISAGELNVFDGLNIFNFFITDGLENGYKIYTYVISLVAANYTIFLLLTHAFICYSFYRFIKKYSTNYIISMVIYFSLFFLGSMSLMRQSLSMAIILWGYKYIKERKFFKYLLLVLLATSIHQTSIIMIIPYFMYKNKINLRSVLAYILCAIIAFIVVNDVVLLLADANTRYGFYLDRIDSFSLGSFLTAFMFLGMNIAMYALYKHNISRDNLSKSSLMERSFSLKMMTLATLTMLVSIRVNSLNRLALYFMCFSIISFPMFMNNKHLRDTRMYQFIFIVLLIVYCFTIQILKPEWLNVINYQTIWSTTQ